MKFYKTKKPIYIVSAIVAIIGLLWICVKICFGDDIFEVHCSRNTPAYFLNIYSDVIKNFPRPELVGKEEYAYHGEITVSTDVRFTTRLTPKDLIPLIENYLTQYEYKRKIISKHQKPNELYYEYTCPRGLFLRIEMQVSQTETIVYVVEEKR
jgi:hypothetical protein